MPEDHMMRFSIGFYVNIMHLFELEFIDLLSISYSCIITKIYKQ